MQKVQMSTSIPTRIIGPIHFQAMYGLKYQMQDLDIEVPLATFETTLFHSIARGAKLTRLVKTLQTVILSDLMTRSLLFEAPSAHKAHLFASSISASVVLFQEEVVSKQSRYAKLVRIDSKVVGSLVYLRMSYETGLASGHNMTTLASDAIASYIQKQYPEVVFLSVSGNYCVDKKVSAVNSIFGRGKSVVAEITIPRDILYQTLKTTPEKIVELNIKKNLIGSIAAGSLLSANAHYANMLLAFYLATGQDAANIVEGSQGITTCEVKNDNLVFSVSLPSIIVGTIGHGKDTADSKKHLDILQATGPDGSEKLAHIAAAVVLCGELSLLAALTNQGELSQSHAKIERHKV